MNDKLIRLTCDNMKEEWIRINDKILSLEIKKDTQVVIEVTMSAQPFSKGGDVLELKYFFPIANYLDNKQINYELKINIVPANYDLLKRICQLFSQTYDKLFFDVKGTILIFSKKFIDYENRLTNPENNLVKHNDRLNAIFTEALSEFYLTNEKHSFEKALNSIHISKINSNKRAILFSHHISLKALQDISTNVSKRINEYYSQYNYVFSYFVMVKLKTYASNIFPIIKVENPLNMNLASVIRVYDYYLSNIRIYKGDSENKFSSQEKKNMIKQLQKQIEIFTEKENDLVKALFRFMIRNYIERKELFSFFSKGEIDISLLKKIFADAKSYSEGILQIIENSCLYSCGKCAFFGMRVYNADRQATMSEIEKSNTNRIMLYEKYKRCIQKKANGDINPNHIFNDIGFSDFLELFVIDNAENKKGIVTDYNSKISNNEFRIVNIDELINETVQDFKKRNIEEESFYIVHYGLRWFSKIIEKNRGYIMIVSPDGPNQVSYFVGENTIKEKNFDDKKFADYKNLFFTESTVLIPLSYKWKDQEKNDGIVKVNKYLFGDKIITDNIEFTSIDITNESGKNEDTITAVNYLYDTYFSNNLDQPYMLVNLAETYQLYDVEILAKALFKHIFRSYKNDKNRNLYIAIDFKRNRILINEFVRIFSVFYDKFGTNEYMQNTQIALASDSNVTIGCKEINFIIGGVNLSSAYATANTFVYYNSESSAEFIPLLDYLTTSFEQHMSPSSEVSLFPFDLFINTDNGDSWFLNRMYNILSSDIRKKSYGCKIEKVHIRISSRLHLDTFYEAELLFHNVSNVYRFAYLIARDIILDTYKENNIEQILILGYENYSSILIQQIAKWIKSTLDSIVKVNVVSAIVSDSEIHKTNIAYLDNEPDDKKTICYSVIPIGTTMSTVYKLHNSLSHEPIYEKTAFGCNYAVVSVSDNTDSNEDINSNIVVKKYWNGIDTTSHMIHLNKEQNGEEGIDVKYYLRAKTTWHNVSDCDLCKDNIPLIQVDRTSTLPNSIFELYNSNRHFPQENESALLLFAPSLDQDFELKEIVKYSHLVRGNNHFQFYFDYEKYVQNAEDHIIKWAKQIKIDNNAYNIVISPLSISNTRFLKIIIENVFSSSLRFLHIDVNGTYKEDIRARFSYISQDYECIKKNNSNAKINFYFVDDSIVTGETINRARMLLKMLVDEAGLKDETNIYFKKVFLLINRSSFETARMFVKNVENDYHSFCNIFIPSYNTSNNVCPGCNIQNKYELLRKRSASYMLSSEFARLAKKHEKRTPIEYESWITEQILNNNTFFSMLKMALFNKTIIQNDFTINLREQIIEYIFEKFKPIDSINFELINQSSLNDFFEFAHTSATDRKKVINIIRYLIAQKSYRRLITMNKAYKSFQELSTENSDNFIDLKDRTKAIIKQLLTNCSDDIEDVISYVKVISREYLSKFYHIRVAISELMLEMLNDILCEKNDKQNWTYRIIQSLNEKDFNPLKYQLVITILHRLAMLQTPEVLKKDNAILLINFFESEIERYEQYVIKNIENDRSVVLLSFPSRDTILCQYMKSLKTATMLNNDAELCNRLMELNIRIREE